MQLIQTFASGLFLILVVMIGLIVLIVAALVYYAFEIALFLAAAGFLYWAIDRTF